MEIKYTYIKSLCTGILITLASCSMYAQKQGLPENRENIIKWRYPKLDYSLPNFPASYPLRDRFYFFTDGGVEANWESLNTESEVLSNALFNAGLGFQFSPIHALEVSFRYAAYSPVAKKTKYLSEPNGDFGGNVNYVINLTAFGNKTSHIQKLEAYGITGAGYRYTKESRISINAGIRVMYNPLPLVGIYAQSGLSVEHSCRGNKQYVTLPYLNAGFMLRLGKPQIYVGDYLPPFAFKTNLLFDLASALNFEIEFPIEKRVSIAAEWIFPWWTLDNHAQNSRRSRLQILNGNLELRYWFGNRENKGLLNGWFAGVYGGGGLYDVEWKGNGVQGEFFIATGLSGGYTHRIANHLSLEYAIGAGVLRTDYRTYKAHFCDDGVWYPIREKRGRYTWFGPSRAKISLVWIINESDRKGGRK